jgi:hypothetical protein
VACSGWWVLVCADHQRGALDLKGRVWSISDHTRLIKSCVCGPWITIGRREKKERSSPRFPVRFAGEAAR